MSKIFKEVFGDEMDIFKRLFKRFDETVTPNQGSEKELEELKNLIGIFPPGHFYSPIADLYEIRKYEASIWAPPPR